VLCGEIRGGLAEHVVVSTYVRSPDGNEFATPSGAERIRSPPKMRKESPMSSRIAHPVASVVGGAFMLCGLVWLGCGVTQMGATAADLARARDQAAAGATTFAGECAKCHGQRGEGLGGAPALLGRGALPEYPRNIGSSGDPSFIDAQQLQIEMQARPAGAAWRDPFRNAQDLYSFTSTHMPKMHAGELKQGDYWAVVNFLLAAQGASLPTGGIGPANASSLPIPRR
jgi:mono/diheme cytochrome c family protein